MSGVSVQPNLKRRLGVYRKWARGDKHDLPSVHRYLRISAGINLGNELSELLIEDKDVLRTREDRDSIRMIAKAPID